MKFLTPEWLFLLPALAAAGWFFKSWKLWLPLRAISLLLLVLVLARPQVRQLADGIDLWVLLDRSESTEDLVDKNLPEWENLLAGSRRDADDRIILVDYASEVVRQRPPENEVYTASRKLTRTRLAVDNVLATADPKKPTRVLLFTDGFSTEPLGDVGEKLVAQGVPLDIRLLRDPDATDFRIAALDIPPRAQIAEPFVLEIVVVGNQDAEVPLTIFRNDQELMQEVVEVRAGRGSLRLTDRIGTAGAHRYKVSITPEGDSHIGNNTFENWIEVAGGPRILLVSTYVDDPLVPVLQGQGFTVDLVSSPPDLHIGQLAGAEAVIFNNVPAWEIPPDVLSSLEFFVRGQGGGFLMAGGKKSFGAGGYFESAIDPLLPVSMELKNEHRKLAVAMAIVMDRSGSMSATVGGGGMSKMDLANEGAARAIELLGAMDSIVVFAVDSEAHEIVPLMQVQPNRPKILNLVRRIESTGGGIYVYNGLEAAWAELKKTTVGTRHIILFSDAADSEQPGAYKTLVKEITDNGGSVSVIGLGSKSDSDAAFIEDVAKRGNGRIFFSNRPRDLPNIFAQETVAVARSTFVEEPTGADATGHWYEISGKSFDWLSDVGGYNLSYLRQDATSALDTTDGYDAPLVAYWNQGTGRTAAVSFPLGGDFSERTRTWPLYGDFIQTLSRWLIGDQLPPGVGIRHRLDGTLLTIDLIYEPEWQQRFAKTPPEIVVATGVAADETTTLTWERMAPGHFTATADLEEGELVRGAVSVANAAIPFGPVIVGSSAEWAFDTDRVDELRTVAAQSGGKELLDLEEAWRSPAAPRFADIRLPLFIVLLVIVLADALFTRMGWTMPEFALPSSINRKEQREAARKQREIAKEHRRRQLLVTDKEKPAAPQSSQIAPPPAQEKETKQQDAARRASRFKRAKK